jgi:hypothetical protein
MFDIHEHVPLLALPSFIAFRFCFLCPNLKIAEAVCEICGLLILREEIKKIMQCRISRTVDWCHQTVMHSNGSVPQ